MPSTQRAAKSRKTTSSAKSCSKSPKTASKAGVSSQKNVRAKGGSDLDRAPAKGRSTTASTKSTKSPGKLPVKAAAKKAAAEKKISSKSPAKNSRATASKAASSKGEATKNKAAVVPSRGRASAPVASSKSNQGKGTETEARAVPKKSATKSVSAKHVVPAARTQAAKSKNVSTSKAPKDKPKTAPEKSVSVKKIQEKNIQQISPQDTPAINPVVDSPTQTVGVKSLAAASTTPAASEPIQVAKNISETAAKAAAPKPIQPVATTSPSEVNAVATKVAQPMAKPVAQIAKPRPASQKLGFKMSEFIVYPAHGVGQIIGIEVQEVAGFSLELFVVSFIKDKMILKVPTSKVVTVGMRKLAELEVVEKALGTLSGRARIKRTMWSRRAQEYEAKINSGDLVTIAEVVRDLYRSDTQPEQSYSERQLYEAALDRMAREIAAVRKLIDSEALKLIESFLLKGPRRGAKLEVDIIVEADDADVDRAA